LQPERPVPHADRERRHLVDRWPRRRDLEANGGPSMRFDDRSDDTIEAGFRIDCP
jgi:hypothetical protein